MMTDTHATTELTKTNHRAYAMIILLLCSTFLFYKYILQNFPSIITTELMQDFHLSGVGLGNLTATFFYSFIIMQFMVGILLDKWGTRYLTSAAILLGGIGATLFSFAETELTAGITRAFMGVGVAFATVAYMKLMASWFDAKHYALVAGLLVSAAMVGAIFGQAPLAFFIHHYGWRSALFSLGIFGILFAITFLMVVRDTPNDRVQVKRDIIPITWAQIGNVLTDKRNWMLTLYGGLSFSPLVIFGGLWGNPFLQEAHQLTATQAASILSMAFAGLGIGSPVLGLLSDRLGDRWHLMVWGTLVSLICISVVIYSEHLSVWALSAWMFVFGFSLGVFMLVFSVGKEINSLAVTATVVAMINASDAILDAITDPLIGYILDVKSNNQLVNGIYHFSVHDYRFALTLLPIYIIASIVCLLIFKKWNKRAST